MDTQGDISNLDTRLCRNTVGSYDAICRNFEKALNEASKRLKEGFYHYARNSQQGVRNSVDTAAERTRSLFAGELGVSDNCMKMFIKRATGKGELARFHTSASSTPNWNAYAGSFRRFEKSANVSPTASMLMLPGAHKSRDQLECGTWCGRSCSVVA